MMSIHSIIASLCLVIVNWGIWPTWGDQHDGTYRNPVIPADYSDIDCIRVEDTYYAISSTFQFSPGMTILRSKDLVNWVICGHAVPDLTQISDQLNFSAMNRYARGIWAGSLRYYHGRFYVFFGTPDEGFFMTSAAQAEGPWEPLTPLLKEAGWDDCSAIWDEQGKGYFVGTCFKDNYKTYLFEMSSDGKRINRESARLIHEGNGREANKLIHHDGWYYLVFSEHQSHLGRYVMARRSRRIDGPYDEERQLLLPCRDEHEPNQGGIVEGPDGHWYFLTHHGTGDWAGRIMSLLPVEWDDGWPMIGLRDGNELGRMAWSGKMPTIIENQPPLQTSDDFSSEALQNQWQWNYQPRDDMYSLKERPGWLRMKAYRPLEDGNLLKTGNILTQRIFRSSSNSVTISVDLTGMVNGQHAGLCHFSKSSSALGICMENGHKYFEYGKDSQCTRIKEFRGNKIWLRSEWGLDGTSYYSYSLDGNRFETYEQGYQLSWGYYRGDRIGIYTYNSNQEAGYIDVDYFKYIVDRQANNTLESDFLSPPESARPYVWWHWLGPNFSKEGITKDLEAMKASGVGGATIFNITSSVMESHAPTLNNPWPDQSYRGDKYWEALRHAASEAKRLGLELGLHNTIGYSTTGGPWIDEARSMQHLVWSIEHVKGGRHVKTRLKSPTIIPDEGWGKTNRNIHAFTDIAVLAVPEGEDVLRLSEIKDLTKSMDQTGMLNWKAPAGKWVVYRLAYASTGRPPHPVPDDVLGKALEADKINLDQTRYHWQQVIDPLKQHLGSLVGTGLKHLLIDSYEAGHQNWTPGFREAFLRLKGYDPLPWLMTFNPAVLNERKPGSKLLPDSIAPKPRVIESTELSSRFYWDYKDVISRLFHDNGWKPAADMIHEAGMTLQHEPYTGPFDTAEGSALADLPMSEYWSGRLVKTTPVVVKAARAAGKPIIGAEALTGAPQVSQWSETPAFLKKTLDGGYVNGMNRMILHHWVHQPFDDRYKPGLGMGWWGTHFGRHQTWYEPGKEFFKYMARVQTMLQKGETTVYTLSVGATSLPADIVSVQTFVNDARVDNGKVILPSGRQYPVLFIPNGQKMLPEVVVKLERLIKAGAVVVSEKPEASPSMKDYPRCDTRIHQLANQIWGNDSKPVIQYGKGRVYLGNDISAINRALYDMDCPPLVTLPSESQVQVLQRTDGQASWFFLVNDTEQDEELSASFAVDNLLPEFWDAESGTIRDADEWYIKDHRIVLPVKLLSHHSLFVVFRHPVPKGKTSKVPSCSIVSNSFNLSLKAILTLSAIFQVLPPIGRP